MPHLKPIIVTDCGPLIALAKLEHLHLLPLLFAKLYLPKTVYEEATLGVSSLDSEHIKQFVANGTFAEVHNAARESAEIAKMVLLQSLLDTGEAEAICLAEKLRCPLLVDEKLARAVATRRGIPILGVLGVLIQIGRASCRERV